MPAKPIEKFPGISNFIKCSGLRKDESVLILTDSISEQRPVMLIFEKLSSMCSKVCLENLSVTLKPDLPKNVKAKINEFDVILLLASQSWYQTPTRRAAKHKFNKRVIECYGLTRKMLKDGGLCADYRRVRSLTRKFKDFFKVESRLMVRTKNGTEFTAKIKSIYEETGIYTSPGTGGNLPGGEISFGIARGSLSGGIVFDTSFDTFGRLEKHPLTILVEKGRVVRVYGRFRKAFETLTRQEPRLLNVAEVGVGTNGYSITGRSVLEDEKKLGTLHVGFGNDTYFGGTVGGAHMDGVLSNPSIYSDNKLVMDNGDVLTISSTPILLP